MRFWILLAVIVPSKGGKAESITAPTCRFAPLYTVSSILRDPTSFEQAFLHYEGLFHQHNVSYNAANGMTFDGTLLDITTGVHRTEGLHTFSAASKESLHFMALTHVISGDGRAAQWILAAHGGGTGVEKARNIAMTVLEKKWQSYTRFNTTYPGFGGFLPWFAHTEFEQLAPTWDWVNRVPALDNGENIWAIYALVEALEQTGPPEYRMMSRKWQGYLDYLKTTANTVFYRGSGRICAVTSIANQSLPVHDLMQSYVCEGLDDPDPNANPFINDPYEGQGFMLWLYFFGGFSSSEKDAMWQEKRERLVEVQWERDGFEPVSVQRGFWFSAHENWGWMQLPYTDIPLMKTLFFNMECARTCDSLSKGLPGMFASINNITDTNGEIIGYISNAGIPQIANQTVQELDVITPYSAMNTMLVNKTVGLAWWHNIVLGKRMQNPYGSSESTRIAGDATSAFVSWDSKMTTVNALFGGVTSFVRSKMMHDGIYSDFLQVVQREYGRVFGELKSAGGLCLPVVNIPDRGLRDFEECR